MNAKATLSRAADLYSRVEAPRSALLLALATLLLGAAIGLARPWALAVLLDDVLVVSAPSDRGDGPPARQLHPTSEGGTGQRSVPTAAVATGQRSVPTAAVATGQRPVLTAAVAEPSPPGRLAALLPSSRPRRLAVVIALGAALSIAGTLVSVAHHRAKTRLGLATVNGLRSLLIARLLRLPLSFHEGGRAGETAARVSTHAYALWSLLESGLFAPLSASITLAGAAAVLLALDARLACAAALVGPPLLLAVRRYASAGRASAGEFHEREGALAADLAETLSSMRLVQAAGAEEEERRKVERAALAAATARAAQARVDDRFRVAGDAVLGLGMAGVLALGGMAVLEGRITAGALAVAASYVAMLYAPLSALAYTAGSVAGALASLDRVVDILDRAPEPAERLDAKPLPASISGRVDLEGIWFTYPGAGAPALRGVTLAARPGEITAIVGASGAGKSTLVSLVPRFMDPSRGAVRLDGADVRDAPLRDVRSRVALVPQETALFAGTLRENVAYGSPGASDEQVMEALRRAQAEGLVRSLPGGLAARVGERGARLSGGERQRIAIARAFLKDAPVLVLDEPTAALDQGTEAEVMDALLSLARGRTTLLVTHRLALARRADRVLVLERGLVVEEGAPASLLEAGGPFARLVAAGTLEPAKAS